MLNDEVRKPQDEWKTASPPKYMTDKTGCDPAFPFLLILWMSQTRLNRIGSIRPNKLCPWTP